MPDNHGRGLGELLRSLGKSLVQPRTFFHLCLCKRKDEKGLSMDSICVGTDGPWISALLMKAGLMWDIEASYSMCFRAADCHKPIW